MLTLFSAPGTCALASHLVLEFAGAQYVVERVNFKLQAQKSPEYLKINPKGRVPALATDRGILTETPAILQFIAQTHPQANLAPLNDPFELARINEFNSYLCATVHVAHAHGPRARRWTDDEAAAASMRAKVPQNVGECFELIETKMMEGPWVMGERFTICDPYLFTIASWLEGDEVNISRFPKVAAHRERMHADTRVIKVLEAVAKA